MRFLRPVGIVLAFWLVFGTILGILIPWYVRGDYGGVTPIWPALMFFVGLGVAIWDYRKNPKAGATVIQPSDRLAILKELADLHDRGAITDEEFEAKKSAILERL